MVFIIIIIPEYSTYPERWRGGYQWYHAFNLLLYPLHYIDTWWYMSMLLLALGGTYFLSREKFHYFLVPVIISIIFWLVLAVSDKSIGGYDFIFIWLPIYYSCSMLIWWIRFHV
jgi:hypothetical protein